MSNSITKLTIFEREDVPCSEDTKEGIQALHEFLLTGEKESIEERLSDIGICELTEIGVDQFMSLASLFEWNNHNDTIDLKTVREPEDGCTQEEVSYLRLLLVMSVLIEERMNGEDGSTVMKFH
jgi:hypothetical protein